MDEAVGDNLLKLVYRHSLSTCIPGALALCFIGYTLSLKISGNIWLYWVIIAMSVQLSRPLVLKLFITNSMMLPMRRQLKLLEISTIVYGAVIGVSVLFFPHLEPPQQLTISLVLVGTSGAAGTINAGYSPLYLRFVIPIMIPLGAFWLIDPGDYLRTIVSIMVGGLTLMMIWIMSVMGAHNFRTFSDFVVLSNRQALMSAELSDALQRAESEQEHAVASNLSKTRFLAAASHDLRQPVHIVSLCGAALQKMAKQDDIKEVVDDMNQAVGTLSKQVNELLKVARLDSDWLKPNLKQLELGAMIKLMTNEFSSEASAKGISLVNSVGRDIHVYSDAAMLAQILRNIVGNAIKYTSEGTVTLSAQKNEDCITLWVVDTGIGMSEDDQRHIFEEFYQINNPERDIEKGIGLGLSIVDRLTNTLSHEIEICSKPDEGTRVSLQLPRGTGSIGCGAKVHSMEKANG